MWGSDEKPDVGDQRCGTQVTNLAALGKDRDLLRRLVQHITVAGVAGHQAHANY